jgi:hypothetical protein
MKTSGRSFIVNVVETNTKETCHLHTQFIKELVNLPHFHAQKKRKTGWKVDTGPSACSHVPSLPSLSGTGKPDVRATPVIDA